MKYADELGSSDLIHKPIFIKDWFTLSKVNGGGDTKTQHGDHINLLLLFQSKESRLFFNWYCGGWNPRSTRHCGQQWPSVPAPGDCDDGEICGMIGRGNRRTRRKPIPVPLCPPQTPNAVRTRTRPAAVGSRRLTA
jgi:hypothetical protein